MADPTVIAVDGPAAAGKGTLARRIARHFGFAHLDTGLLYRAVALAVLRSGADPADPVAAAAAARGLDPAQLDPGQFDPSQLDDPALRDEATGRAAGVVAALAQVRAALLDIQRRFAAAPPGGAPGAVLDGRDIGTVIWPAARCKIFIEASPAVRAARRVKELQDKGLPAIPGHVLQDMLERDRRDRGRAVAPLVPASDAFVLDTTALDAEAAFAAALAYILSCGITPPPSRR